MQRSNKQVTHFYVVSGAVSVVKDNEGMVKLVGTDFTSDLIDPKTMTFTASKAARMKQPLQKVTVTVKGTDDYTPKKGDELFINLRVPQFGGLSDYETLERQGNYVVRADGEEAADIAAGLATSLKNNMKTLFEQVVNVTVSGAVITIEAATPATWKKGVFSQQVANFTVTADNVDIESTAIPTSTGGLSGFDYDWCAIQNVAPTSYMNGGHNGKLIADLEYFYLGERGDQYRQVGFPNVIDSDYKVDPTKDYDMIDIHYAFTDEGVSSYRTEKNIILVGEPGTNFNTTLLASLNAVNGTNIQFKPEE